MAHATPDPARSGRQAQHVGARAADQGLDALTWSTEPEALKFGDPVGIAVSPAPT